MLEGTGAVVGALRVVFGGSPALAATLEDDHRSDVPHGSANVRRCFHASADLVAVIRGSGVSDSLGTDLTGLRYFEHVSDMGR